MLKIKGLSKKKKDGFILNDLNFQVDHGKIAVFLGNSGVGKTTILRILNNLEFPDSGSITLDGETLDLERVNETHTVGIVFQHFNLFENLTVLENIMLGLQKCKNLSEDEAQHIAKTQLKKFGIEEKAHEYIQKLSGGQKQRVALARTLALDPKIICLDEPTSALDPRLVNQVGEMINLLASEQRIILLTTHDTKLLETLNGEVYLMENGTIVAQSSIASCQDHPKISQFLRGTL